MKKGDLIEATMDKTEAAPQPLGAAGSDSTPAAATNQAPALQVADAASGGVPSKGGGGRGDGDGGGEGSGSKPPANRRDSEFTSEIFKVLAPSCITTLGGARMRVYHVCVCVRGGCVGGPQAREMSSEP